MRKGDYEVSSGNVFADLGLPDANERLLKADIALYINRILAKRELKQTEAARVLGTTQAKVSLLAKGRLHGFSLEKLLAFLTRLDRNVDIVVKPKSRRQPVGEMQVSLF